MPSLLPKAEVKAMLIADMEGKTKHEFFHDGMTCQGCGYSVHAGDPMYRVGGKNCCSTCKNDIIKTIKENL